MVMSQLVKEHVEEFLSTVVPAAMVTAAETISLRPPSSSRGLIFNITTPVASLTRDVIWTLSIGILQCLQQYSIPDHITAIGIHLASLDSSKRLARVMYIESTVPISVKFCSEVDLSKMCETFATPDGKIYWYSDPKCYR